MAFLLRLLIVRGPLLLWAKSSLSPRSAHKAGSGPDLHPEAAFAPLTPTPSVPKFLVSSFLSQPELGPSLAAVPPSSALCPPFLPQPQGRGARDGGVSVVPRDLQMPRFRRMAL